MNRYLNEQLMTVEEAQRLSDPHFSHEANEQRRRLWAWRSVADVMAQTISDSDLERLEKLTLPK